MAAKAKKEAKVAPAPAITNKNPTAPVFIPKTNREDTETYVAVNGKNAVIRNGEVVHAPAHIAWAVRDAQRMQAAGEKFIDANRKN